MLLICFESVSYGFIALSQPEAMPDYYDIAKARSSIKTDI